MVAPPTVGRVRLAELVALLSLGTDLGIGSADGARDPAVPDRAAACASGSASTRPSARSVYYSGLLAWVGCHVDAYEQAKWFGDDIALKARRPAIDFGRRAGARRSCSAIVGAGQPLLERAASGWRSSATGGATLESMLENHWLATDELAARLGLARARSAKPRADLRALGRQGLPVEAQGRGDPARRRGWSNLADVSRCSTAVGGVEAAVAVARERSGTQFDPALVDLFCERAPRRCSSELDAAATWDAVIDAEPALASVLSEDERSTMRWRRSPTSPT